MDRQSEQKTDGSLFNIGHDPEEKLRLPSSGTTVDDGAMSPTIIFPTPGFCVKTKAIDTQEKVFLNICTSEQIGQPRDISGEELKRVLEEGDVGSFRVPMSLGPAHAELDKSGKACTAHDVIVHPSFCAKVQTNEVFFGFLVTACVEGLEEKYDVKLDLQSCVLLKNKRHVGTLESQMVRTRARPFVVEMDPATSENAVQTSKEKKKLVCEVENLGGAGVGKTVPKPNYVLAVEPSSGTPEFIVVEVFLPGVKSSKTITLDVGEDCLVLNARPDKFWLELDLPHWVYPERGGSQFNHKTHMLTVTLPVQEGEGSGL